MSQPQTDPRIERYRRATKEMVDGRYDVDIPVGPSDAIGRLGEALRSLARTLEEKFESAAKLARITESVNEAVVLDEVLAQVYESFRSVIPFDRLGLALLEESDTTVRSMWARSEAAEICLPVGYVAPLAGSSLVQILRTGEPRILNDLEDYLRLHPDSDSTRRIVAEGMRSSLTCPLVASEKPVGFLFFSSFDRDTYSAIHQGHFLQIAGQLSVIIDKSRLYGKLVKVNQKLRAAQRELRREATRDSLTALWNRRAILRLLERELARARRDKKPLAAVMVDIDHFKRINDDHGHFVGDEVLRELTRRLDGCLRSSELFGRLGGEEFLIILYPSDQDSARLVMERARQSCACRPFATEAGELEVTISLGGVVVEKLENLDLSAVLRAADRALYRAKDRGRNRVEVDPLD